MSPLDPPQDNVAQSTAASAAEVLLTTLKSQGVDYFICNPGTDFPSIVEAFSAPGRANDSIPEPMVVPHENLAVSLAHGYYLATGKPQAVMVHTSVGTANALNAMMNAYRDQAPILLAAGRSPILETGPLGARNGHIHWGQEMFDQASMLREMVKWDYELRYPDQVGDMVGRALEVSMTYPRGPVYFTLPREVLAARTTKDGAALAARRAAPAAGAPDAASLARLADWLVAAKKPLIVTGAAGRFAPDVEALARLAEVASVPVTVSGGRYMNMAHSHPMFAGYNPNPMIKDADLIIVADCDVPWIPSAVQPPASCKVAHLGPNPGFSRMPMRLFPSDLAIAADMATTLNGLADAVAKRISSKDPAVAARRAAQAERAAARLADLEKRSAKPAGRITQDYLSHCVGQAIGPQALICNEYPLSLDFCDREEAGSYFAIGSAGGLGWSLCAALGVKLARPDRLVVCTVGDGAYMFANPTACHWTSQRYDLPILTIIFNNGRYNAVARSTFSIYPDGAARHDNFRALADLSPVPDYKVLVEAHGGYGVKVEDPAELPGALARARDVVTKERRQAVVDVIIS